MKLFKITVQKKNVLVLSDLPLKVYRKIFSEIAEKLSKGGLNFKLDKRESQK